MAMNIAIVRSAEHLDYYDKDWELSNKINEVALNDSRYGNVKAIAVAWEEPNDWTQFTHIIITEGLEYSKCHQKFLDWLDGLPRETQNRIFNPPQVIKWNINKIYLKELKQKGISLPASVFIPPGDEKRTIEAIVKELEQQAGNTINCIVIKNMIDAGGNSVHRIQLTSEVNGQEILDRAVNTFQGGILVQEYLKAINEEGEWSIICIDNQLSHGMSKLPSSSGFRVQKNFGGSSKITDLESVPTDVIDFAKTVLKNSTESKLLYARIDIIRGNDGLPKLLELEVFEPELYLHNSQLVIKFLDAISKY